MYRCISSLSLKFWKLVALLYWCISSITDHSISQSLLHCCTGVYLAWLNLWKLAALLYRCTSPVCGCCAAPDVPNGQTRVGSCSRWLTPVEARTPSGCTCRSVNFSRGPTVPPATSCNDSDDSLKSAWGGYNADGGLYSAGIHDCSLLHDCTCVHQAQLGLWKFVTRLYRCISSTIHSLKAGR